MSEERIEKEREEAIADAGRLSADLDEARSEAQNLARAVIELAGLGGMPDSYMATDSRIKLAREVLDR